MFDKKVFLYFALAFVGFLLWNAWQKDYGPTPGVVAAPTATTSPVTAQGVETNITQETPANRIIEIATDTFLIKIDKQGGNIVSLKLPKYPATYETSHTPVELLNSTLSNYYAVESGLKDKTGLDTGKVLFNSDKTTYQMTSNINTLTVVLTSVSKGLEVKKTYTFQRGKYDINVNYVITNRATQPWVGNIYAQIKRRGISEENGSFGLKTYRGAAISSPENPYEKITYQKMNKENLNRTIKSGWVAMQQRYFVTALVPDQQGTFQYYSNIASVGSTDKPQDKIYTIGFISPDISVAPNSTVSVGFKLYSGPEIAAYLKAVAPNLDRVIDFGWLWWASVPIFKVMQAIYSFVGNWGLAIILVTVLIKLLFYKLSEASYRSMAKMRNLQPRLLALKEKYGDDRQKLSQETMELYRKEKVNPLGGCLPMIVQIPVFIALYYVLIESVELRQAPFMLWIHDLSAKDPYFVLPILMGLSWVWQQKLNPPPTDPMQAKMMMMFPIVFTILFATFPSGLVLYWLVNNCVSILQQWYIMRKYEQQEAKKKTRK